MKGFLKFSKERKRPKVEKRPWMEECVMELVTPETLSSVIDKCIESGLYALDLECTGLDNRVFDGRTKDQIVGACLSHDGVHGYYLPVRHASEGAKYNIPVSQFESELRRLVNSEAVAIFHHGKYDHEFLEFCGGEPIGEWDNPKEWEDSLILAFLNDSRLSRVGLKYLADKYLNPNYQSDVIRRRNNEKVLNFMIELEELFPPDHDKKKDGLDFSILDPTWEPVIWYGASDAICTYRLYKKLYPLVITPESGISQRTIYNIEKMCCAATRWMERCRVAIDQDKVAELTRLGQQEYFDSIKAIYNFCEEVLGRDVAPAWWHVLAKGVVYEGDKENLPPLFNPDDVESPIGAQIEEAKKIVAHNRKRPAWDRSEQLAQITEQEGKKLEKQLSTGELHEFPFQYDVMSPRQLGPLFEEMEVPDLRRTEKSNQVMTTAAEMDRLTELHGDTYPFMARIKRFREVQKALSQYLIPLRRDAHPADSTIRISYRGWAVDTGRFAVKGDKQPSINGGTSFPMHGTPATYDQDKPECLRRVRECIVARPGRILCGIDYAGVELRIVTNLSREPKWIAEYFRCSSCEKTFDRGDGKSTPQPPPPFCPRCGSDKIGDLHTLSTIAFYGEECQKDKKKFKQLRQQSKAANFALCYGGSGKAVVRSTGVDDNEGWRIYRQFTGTYKGLQNWWKAQHEFARKNGYVNTAFGRRYPVPDILLPKRDPKTGRDNGAFIAKAERNAVNGPIQGCLHGDSRIPTSLGLQRIEDLAGKTFQVWTGSSWQDARAFSSGDKKLQATVFDSGRVLQTSPDHRFRVWTEEGFEWVRQEDLTPDSWVAVNSEPIELPEPKYDFDSVATFNRWLTPCNRKSFSLWGNSETLWEFLGMVYGDGSIGEDYLVVHVGEPESHIETEFEAETYALSWADKLNRELNVGATVRESKRTEAESHKRSTWQIKVHGKVFREFCRDVLGVEDQNVYTKRFPQAIWRESIRHRAAFLRGYFSADGGASASGDTASVRSVNCALLQDTQALLHSIGIRASYRPRSLRVTVLDRLRFRELVGFSLPWKTERLVNLKINPWMGQWHRLPPRLIRAVGECVYGSTVYASLDLAEKSAVLRLRAGSGSKPQCLKYLARVPTSEVPSALTEALKYDYETPTGVADEGRTVSMYDVEVFDGDHAFVCDGVVVHNSSADITKLAMALVYKAMKKRGWLEKVYMTITIHDELVFEIEKDIVEDALEVIMPLMARSSPILKLKWPVPLTLDCELGYDWTVPWDLVQYQEGKTPWPEELKPYFPKGVAASAAKAEGRDEDPSQEPQEASSDGAETAEVSGVAPSPSAPEAAPEPSAGTENKSPAPDPPAMEKGEVFVYRIRRKLCQGTVEALAQILHECRDRGSKHIEIRSTDGSSVIWRSSDFTVNPTQFSILADRKGL